MLIIINGIEILVLKIIIALEVIFHHSLILCLPFLFSILLLMVRLLLFYVILLVLAFFYLLGFRPFALV